MRRLRRSEVRSLLDLLQGTLEESFAPLRTLAGLLDLATSDVDVGRVLDELFPHAASTEEGTQQLKRLSAHLKAGAEAADISLSLSVHRRKTLGRARRVAFYGAPPAPIDQQLRALSGAHAAMRGAELIEQLGTRLDDVRVLVVTANENEDRAVRDVFGQAVSASGDRSYTLLPPLGRYQIFHLICEQGPVDSALAVSDATRALQPSLVIAVGMAFGIRPDEQVLCDVLVAKQVIDCDYERIGESMTLARGARTDAPAEWLTRVKNAHATHGGHPDWPTLHVGPLLSGSKLIDDATFRDDLSKRYGGVAIGGEMEGRGIVRACTAAGCPWLIIKGIADWAAAKPKGADKARVQYMATHAAARVLRATLVPDQEPLARPRQSRGIGRRMPLPLTNQFDESRHRLIENRARRISLENFGGDAGDARTTVVGRNAFDCLMEWATQKPDAPLDDESSPRYFALLGEYGMGKTVLCQRLTRALEQRREQGLDGPQPLYFDLSRLTNLREQVVVDGEVAWRDRVPTRDEVLRECIERGWTSDVGQPKPGLGDVQAWLQEGALVIFDGLDEVLVHLTDAGGQQFVSQLMRVLPPLPRPERKFEGWRENAAEYTREEILAPVSRMVVSCRTHFFRSLRAQIAMLTERGRGDLDGTQLESLLLLPFTDEQIAEYLAKSLPQRDVDRMLSMLKEVHDLQEIASRPYLLSMVSMHIEKIEKWRMDGVPVYGVTIYRELTRSWLARDNAKHQVKPDDKLLLARDIAAELWRRGQRVIQIGALERWFDSWRSALAGTGRSYLHAVNREKLEEDLRNSNFLVREDVRSSFGIDEARSGFRFAHLSFQEYFLAEYLLQAIKDDAADRWDMPAPSKETLDFLGQLLAESGDRDVLVGQLSAWRQPYRKQVSETIVYYACVASAAGLPVPFLGGIDLRSAQLSGVQFAASTVGNERPSLVGANFAGADLRNALITNWRLDGATFVGAQLDLIEFADCSFDDADFSLSSTDAAIFRRCDLRGSIWRDVDRTRMTCVSTQVDPHFEQSTDSPVFAPRRTAVPEPDGAVLARLTRNVGGGKPHRCAFDDERVLMAGRDGSLQIVSTRSLETIAQAQGDQWSSLNCFFSDDGMRLLTSAQRGSLQLWDGQTLRFLAAQTRRSDPVRLADFSSDRRLLVIAYQGRALELCDAETLELLDRGLTRFEALQAIFFSHGDARIGLIENAGAAIVRYLSVSSLMATGDPMPLGQSLALCGRSPDRSEWAMADGNGVVWIRRDGTFEVVAKLSNGESLASMAYSADGGELACVTTSGLCRRWNIARRAEQTPSLRPDSLLSVHSWNKKYIVGADRSGQCVLLNRLSGVVLRARDEKIAAAVTACRFSANDAFFVCGTEIGDLVVWRRNELRPVQALRRHRASIAACAVSAQGDFVLSAGHDGTMVFGRSDTLSPPSWKKQIGDIPVAIAISQHSRRALSVGTSGAVTLWDLDTGESTATFRPESDFVVDAAFSSDDGIVLLCSRDGPRFWNEKTGEVPWPAHQKKGSVSCRFAGEQLIGSNFDRWHFISSGVNKKKPSPGRTLEATPVLLEIDVERKMRGHTTPHALSADGKFVLSCDDDGMLRLWDLATTTCIAEMRCTNTAVASWSLAENRLICAYGDAWRKLGWLARDTNGVMRRWPLEIFGHECDPIPPHLQLA